MRGFSRPDSRAHGESLNVATCIEIASRELGRQWVLPPAELAWALGWHGKAHTRVVP